MGQHRGDTVFEIPVQQRFQIFIMGGMPHKVQLMGIHYHNGHIGDVVEIIHVRPLYILQIIRGDILLEIAAAVGDVFQQVLHIVVEVKDDVGFGKIGGDDVVNFDIEIVLIALQVVFGEDVALVDEVVGDDEVGEDSYPDPADSKAGQPLASGSS